MISLDDLGKNFNFLLLEVTNAVNFTCSYLHTLERGYYDKVISREDHIDNLKTATENGCFSKLLTDKGLDKNDINRIRSIHLISVNLERIADFCVSIVKQIDYLHDHGALEDFGYYELFDEIKKCLPLVLPVLEANDLGGALNVCRAEFELDRLYKKNFLQIMERLREGGHNVGDLITLLFIFRYLERIGDALLNIGEALLFVTIGEKIKITQFRALQQTLSKSGFTDSLANIDYKTILGSRSGCNISKVESPGEKAVVPSAQSSIFKGGSPAKIAREKENIEKWHQAFPDLVPKIYSYHEDEGKAALLEEYLPGCTLDEITLTAEENILERALRRLGETLEKVWAATKRDEPRAINYMKQVLDRLDSIKSVHPALFRKGGKTSGVTTLSTMELLHACQGLEKELFAPFSVFVHGDLNINNIVFDPGANKIRFIDLYRSREADYLQDVSVLLVSFFRVPVFDPATRERFNSSIRTMHAFARNYAASQGDRTFPARLALGLARSLYTSIRFEFNGQFAREMYLRSHFLMEKIIHHHGKPWEDFSFPEEILGYQGDTVEVA